MHKTLIANRGEIAVRILRACHEMGLSTVAVYSDGDAYAHHTTLADEAVNLGPSPATDSYLRGDRILEIARQRACDAIHPGYGFLSENADFAQAIVDSGLTWIGPDPAIMRVMGAKTTARSAVQAVGLPVVPGFQASDDDADLLAAAGEIGFPLLVKATAGGGGKGMRTVANADELPAALASARREARQAFGDDRVYLEKMLSDPRHVEIQVLGDHQGNLVHLFERECSVQRRHQKIVEETPSPLLDGALRRRMCEAAVSAARAVGYTNAGTLEFLVDAQRNFYFLEMNTRLQVEHPITELVTGVDLVKAQIRIAQGKRLPFSQEDLVQRGHALECRVYAEDPTNNFLPSTGALLRVAEPTGPGIRVDSGVISGDEVTLHYDPMLAKAAVLAESRQEAIARMVHALRGFVVLGEVTTNIPFLCDLLQHPRFAAGQATTDFVAQEFADWRSDRRTPDLALIAGALTHNLDTNTDRLVADQVTARRDPFSPWRRHDGFRIGGAR